ncbi:MAG: hypothetical protein JF599_13665 [Verrucomicrobia bacterium]|nr:hypothetical protein [Verrucomicrobiota bacterium]
MEMALREKLCAEDPGLLTSLMLQWASRDFPAAYEWTKTQAAGPWRNDIFARLAYLQAKADPLAGARIVVTEIPPGPARDEATLSVLHQWVLHDSEAASVWAESIPEGPVHQRAVAEIAGLKKISATPGQ